MRILDLTGEKYGYLTVLSLSTRKNTKRSWVCVCDCGEVKHVATSALRNGTVKSCGCIKKKKNSLPLINKHQELTPAGIKLTSMKWLY